MDWDSIHKSNALLEWELACQPLKLYIVDAGGALPPGINELTIERDDEYGLLVKFEGKVKSMSVWMDVEGEDKGWRTVQGFTIKAREHAHGPVDYVLEGCHIINRSASHNPATGEVTASGTLQVWAVIWAQTESKTPDRLVEWYLNGPRGRFYWPDGTSRDAVTTTKVERFQRGLDPRTAARTIESEMHAGSSDAFFLCGKNVSCIIYKVPESLAPDWSSPIGIEYRAEWGIPDAEARIRVAHAASFVFGTELLHLGHTEFAGEEVLRARTTDLRVGPASYVCESLQYSPFDWSFSATQLDAFRPQVVSVADSYLKADKELGIEVAFRYYWLATRSPMGYNFPLLASACEGLVQRWGKAKGGKTSTVMDSATFIKLAKEKLEALMKDFPPETQETILKHLMNANNLSGTQQWKAALTQLGVKTSPDEAEAMEKRHVFAHGKEAEELMVSGRAFDLERAYRSLFIRLVLTILGFTGTFLDHGPALPTLRKMDASSLPAKFS